MSLFARARRTSRGRWSLLILGAALLSGVAGAQAAPGGPLPPYRGALIRDARPIPDVILTDQRGRTFRLRETRGRVVVLAFGYTRCRDLCPLTLGTFKQTYRLLGPQAARARFVLVTVDPAWDAPARLGAYLTGFHREFVGLTGDRAALRRLYRHFEVYPQPYRSETGAVRVGHPTAIFLVDPAGYARLSFNWGGPPADIARDVRLLLPAAGRPGS